MDSSDCAPLWAPSSLRRLPSYASNGQASSATPENSLGHAGEYEAIAADSPGAGGDVARLRIAAMPYYDGEATTAISRLESLGRQAGEVEAERLYYLVQCYRRLERDDEMASMLDALVAAAPASPWRLKALGAGSSRFLVKDDPRQQQAFEACADSFPEAPEAAMCHWHAAWWAYRHRQTGASQLLRRHLQLYPASDKAGAALFYLGRLAAKSGEEPAALSWYRFLVHRYPNYYYSFVARGELRALEARRVQPSRQVDDFLASIRFAERPLQADLTPDTTTSKRLERSRLLARAGLDTWAESELRFAARNGGQPWPLALELAEMASRDGAPDRALRQIKNVLPGYLFMPREGAPQRFWRMAFPLPYYPLIVKYSAQVGLDPFLVAALIRQESEFNPRAVSVSKAIGLMQVMPASGRELARQIPVRGFRTSQLTTPEINIRLGTFYFRRLLDSCSGKMEDALAAYNAGRSRVTLWRGWGPFEDINEFAETIPFAQTRDYVQIILRNAELYRWLYASEPLPSAAAPAVTAKSSGKTAVSASRDSKPIRVEPRRSPKSQPRGRLRSLRRRRSLLLPARERPLSNPCPNLLQRKKSARSAVNLNLRNFLGVSIGLQLRFFSTKQGQRAIQYMILR